MSENKRFVYYEHKGADYILDTPNTELDFIEMLGDALETEEICEKLNEQQATIERLEKENIELKKYKKYCAEWMGVKEENLSLRCVKISENRFGLVEDIYNEIGKQQIEIMDNLEKQIVEKQKVVGLLNEQDRKIRQLEKSIEQREEQISIIKKHCKTYLTEEQYKTIKEALSVI